MSPVAINYDRKFDILYARYINAGHSYGEEDDNGIVTFHSIETDDVTGVAVFSISQKLKDEAFDLSLLPVPLAKQNVDRVISNSIERV